ncbi:TQXA domain-containing protein/LPXTG-motif cell wall-anchored protein [Kutzneria viridogrisea]|nr:thioester domain-containing protein [Kutzneria albida]MBA8929030.1 TQXA domain-containing protein/LPXTG-motif cell wall-anchored protein [Kutzneria viridogrisea]
MAAAAPMAIADDGKDNHGHAKPRDGKRDTPLASVDETHGYNVVLKGDKFATEQTLLIPLKVENTNVLTYCVELNVEIDGKVKMTEVPWDKYPYDPSQHGAPGFKQNSQLINWVLQNSYPNVTPDALGAAITKAGGTLHDGLNAHEAITATQAAIWHLSDGADLDENNATPYNGAEAGADVVAAYKYLLKNAKAVQEPTPGLSLLPSEKTGKTGELIGPFTVKTTASKVDLSKNLPNGVTLTDKDGKAIDKVVDGTEIYVKVPADAKEGNGGFSVDAEAHLKAGRLFVGADAKGNALTQSLIVAKPTDVKLHQEAKANWTVAPVVTTTTPVPSTTTSAPAPSTPVTTTTPVPVPVPASNDTPLAYTGASVIGAIVAGVVLVGAGVGALFFVRRRRAN